MNPDQIQLVQSSFTRIEPIAGQAATFFYARLFELDPALKPLFKGDMAEQGQKLMRMIGLAVQGLNRLDELVPAVQALGQRHASYGVQPQDYDTVGAALLWTLQQGLGEFFTPQVREAWTRAYALLAETMILATQVDQAV